MLAYSVEVFMTYFRRIQEFKNPSVCILHLFLGVLLSTARVLRPVSFFVLYFKADRTD